MAALKGIGYLSGRLHGGTITVDEWHSGMREAIRRMHTCATAEANGGWRNTSQAAWGHSGAVLKFQYGKLEGFASQLADGTQPINGRFQARCIMYGVAGHGTYEESVRRRETDNGARWERRVTSIAENCNACLEAADEGWVPIGTLPPIGSLTCLVNCLCHFEYSDADKTPENP